VGGKKEKERRGKGEGKRRILKTMNVKFRSNLDFC